MTLELGSLLDAPLARAVLGMSEMSAIASSLCLIAAAIYVAAGAGQIWQRRRDLGASQKKQALRFFLCAGISVLLAVGIFLFPV